MKIKGQKLQGPAIETLVLPRGEGVVVIKAQAVLDYSEFEKLCPLPKAPMKILKGGRKVPDFEEKNYKKSMEELNSLRTHFLILKSLQATEDLEWETVDMSNTATWPNYEKELKENFCDIEVQRIIMAVMNANSLNEEKLEQARADFLASQAQQQEKSSSQMEEQKNTPSGELASAPV